jgi:hypothetical protein
MARELGSFCRGRDAEGRVPLADPSGTADAAVLRVMKWTTAIGLVLVTRVVAGCGATTLSSGTDGSADALAPTARADFAGKLATGLCDAIEPCCAAASNAYDAASCRDSVAANLLGLHPEFGAASVDGEYDPVAATRCLDTIARATRACRRMTLKEREACQTVFTGHLAPGSTCTYDAECTAPHGGAASCEGIGQPPAPMRWSCVQFIGVQSEGEACNGNAVDSSDGSINFNGGGLYCPAWDGLRCDSERGVCTSLPRLGERCTSDLAAVWYSLCADGAYCDPNTGICVPQNTTGPCLVTINGYPTMTHACAAGTYCDTEDGAHVYPCRPELADGESCALDAWCASHVCNSERRCGIAAADACRGNINLF